MYAPDGYKFALMNGQTVRKYMAPLAAGLQAVYTSATPAPPAYWRHSDWLGSSRLALDTSGDLYDGRPMRRSVKPTPRPELPTAPSPGRRKM